MHFLGLAGAPRRYADATAVQFLPPLQPVQYFISIAAFVTIVAQLLFLINVIWSLKSGEKAEVNPWQATTLEWTIPSPPPHDNFGGHEPSVHRGPYEYGTPGYADDFLPQDVEPARLKRA
jgi:cytochrome c oxidase subunit 1